MRILLVEDDVQEIVSAFLAAEDHEIVTETNADKALQRYFDEGPFDPVLTDIEHPGMHGVDLMHAIHEKNPKQNVQIITAWPVLQKPFTKEQLLAFVKIGQRRLQ
jgi:DNA-binding response OmpR family regulator